MPLSTRAAGRSVVPTPKTKKGEIISVVRLTSLRTNLGCSRESVTGFSDADVQAQLADLEIAHDILRFVFRSSLGRGGGGSGL